MRNSLRTRWIIALLLLVVACQALAFAPVLRNAAIVFWGLSLALIIVALVLAVTRLRSERAKRHDELRARGR